MVQTWKFRLQNYRYRNTLVISFVVVLAFFILSLQDLHFLIENRHVIMIVSGIFLLVLIHFLYQNKYFKILPKTFQEQGIALIVWTLLGFFFIGFATFYIPAFTNKNICFKRCSSKQCDNFFKKITGKNTFLDILDRHSSIKINRKHCLVSYWGLSHLIGYAIVAFFVPKMWLFILIGGFLWEFFESQYQVSSWFDIVWNSIGVLFGTFLKRKINL